MVEYESQHPAGTIIVDTGNHFLYLVMGNGEAVRYGIGVARSGFEWSGTHRITNKREWPGWTPPPEMRKRVPGLPRYMPGGIDNPLGARALYIGSTLYRIHGTNEPNSIGLNVSSGCIRMLNDDVIDLYERVRVGAKVIVM
jgi:lipoprotein-anchoring transpeptidase ErfK/SrfK